MASQAAAGGTKKLPYAMRMLCQHGGEALQPRYVNNKWRGAAVKARSAARMRKYAIVNGTYGSFDPDTGTGWDPAWDKAGNITSIRPPKQHKRERNREARATKIDSLLVDMDDKILDYRRELESRKPEPGWETKMKSILSKGKGKR